MIFTLLRGVALSASFGLIMGTGPSAEGRTRPAAQAPTPNFVVLFADDWGWGDMGANGYGALTPNMDALAARGVRFTDAHAMSICTPSRAALLTGRLGLRTGIGSPYGINFWTDARYGLPLTEVTLPELLKKAPVPYDTQAIGKWHLGHREPYHPSFRGFDAWTGIPYSVDMGCYTPYTANGTFNASMNHPPPPVCPTDNATTTAAGVAAAAVPPALAEVLPGYANGYGNAPNPALPLYNSTAPNCTSHSPDGRTPDCNADIVQQPVDFPSLADHYVHAATTFIDRHAAGGDREGVPFFLYVPFSHVHVPLFHAAKWTGKSGRGIFGDTLLELDDSIGRIVAALDETGLFNNTLLYLTGDNGPWEVKCELAGSKGPFIGGYQKHLGGGGTGKTSTWEGGHREPGVAVWPGHIAPGRVSNATISTMDLLPTFAALAGVPLPADRVFDGVDLSPVLFGDAPKVRDWLWHPDFITGNITAARYGRYKAFFQSQGVPACNEPGTKVVDHGLKPLIFDLEADPGETTPLDPVPAGLTETFIAALHAQLANISSTFRSVANYSEGGGTPEFWPCCNASHVVCRCTD